MDTAEITFSSDSEEEKITSLFETETDIRDEKVVEKADPIANSTITDGANDSFLLTNMSLLSKISESEISSSTASSPSIFPNLNHITSDNMTGEQTDRPP